MNRYIVTNPELWTGRNSGQQLYLHEKVRCINLEKENIAKGTKKTIAFLGYACDEGVHRNQGRIGAMDGPEEVRMILGKFPNHLEKNVDFLDVGTLECRDGKLENIQTHLAEKVALLLEQGAFPIIVGGGHDIAYGHYNGIKNHVGLDKSIGIINFDAHFDLRSDIHGSNSGTPFYQISQACKNDNTPFHYLCLGIRRDANDSTLFETAMDLGVDYIENKDFTVQNAGIVFQKLLDFITKVDHVYVTIDLDGFSSAYAPGVSAPSPMGFCPKIVLESLELILNSKRLISMDIAEMNPKYDIDHQTAKLAASLIHFVSHNNQLF